MVNFSLVLQLYTYVEGVGVSTSSQGDINILLVSKVTIIDAWVDIFQSLIALNWNRVEALENSNVRETIGVSDLQDRQGTLKPRESGYSTSMA